MSNHQMPSAMHHQPYAIGYALSASGYLPFVIRQQLLAMRAAPTVAHYPD